jgi:hypothetical protein
MLEVLARVPFAAGASFACRQFQSATTTAPGSSTSPAPSRRCSASWGCSRCGSPKTRGRFGERASDRGNGQTPIVAAKTPPRRDRGAAASGLGRSAAAVTRGRPAGVDAWVILSLVVFIWGLPAVQAR